MFFLRNLFFLFAFALVLRAPTHCFGSTDSDLTRAILKDLREMPVPERYDCTILYQRRKGALSAAETEKDPNVCQLAASYKAMRAGKGPDDPKVKLLASALESERLQLVKDEYLLQKQRIWVDGTKVRCEVLEDFGCPDDPQSEKESLAARADRKGICFTDGVRTAVSVIKSQSVVEFLPAGMYYPSLPSLLRPSFFAQIGEMLEIPNVQSVLTRTGNVLNVEYSFPNKTVIRISVDPTQGMKLLDEKREEDGELVYEKTLRNYRTFGPYSIPTRIETFHERRKEIIDVQSLAVDENIEPAVFDYRKELAQGMTVVDCRFSPPLQYRLNEEILNEAMKRDLMSDLSLVRGLVGAGGDGQIARTGAPDSGLSAGPTGSPANPTDHAGIATQSAGWRRDPLLWVLVVLSLPVVLLIALRRHRRKP